MGGILGHDGPAAAFTAAARAGKLHHAWLLTGPAGIGKASWARAAALWLLAGAEGDSLAVAAGHPARALVAAGSHPDHRLLARLPRDPERPGEDLARSITVAQVRSLGAMFATAPALGARRAVVIDAADELERAGANALLKNLEEPPAGTTFLLVSHSPGRLLPTIRSRCRALPFTPLDPAASLAVLTRALPEAGRDELAALAAAGNGAPGRALRFAGLDVAGLDRALAELLATGDPSNAVRSALARELAGKAGQERYAAFLDRAGAALAAAARAASGPALAPLLDAQAAARELAGAALALSLDPAATVFELAGIVAGVARRAA